jgi:flotillin
MPEFLNPIAIALIAVFIAIVLLAWLYARNYVKVPPNQVAVFTGRGKQRTVRGGAKFRVPIIERVDKMELEPFNVQVVVQNIIGKDGVRVNVDGVGLIKFGSTDEAIATAVERFLTSNRDELHRQVQEILAGNMRGIVAQMTVEELNNNREGFRQQVLAEAGQDFARIGMELDVLTIQNITDPEGYLDALGRKRIAEVKRDARIGEAEAERDAQIAAAEAKQAGDVAQAAADTAIAQAQRDRDLELARIAALVEAENAIAEQAGPRARAEANKAVVIAEAEAQRAKEESMIAVEAKRAERSEMAQRADVVVPAEAEKQAAVLRADGDKQAAIARAEAQAEARKLEGAAEAEARTAAAVAHQRELEAAAQGLLADLKARAEGQRDQAEALNSFSHIAAMLLMHEALFKAQVEMTKAAAEPLGNIDTLTVFDNGTGNGGLSSLMQATPTQLAMLSDRVKALFGLDITEMFRRFGNFEQTATASSPNGDTVTELAPSA